MLIAAGLLGCAAEPADGGPEVAVAQSALTWNDGGTVVTVNADVEAARCDGTIAKIGVTGSISATSPSQVDMMTIVDGVDWAQTTVAMPTNFTLVGRDYLASFGTDVGIPDGLHRVDLCFAVVTPRGVSTVRACLPSISTNTACSAPPPPPPGDTTPPTIVGSASPAANSAGWNNGNVTVSFVCADGESGIASCTSDVILSDEGENQSVVGTAVDVAHNSAMTTVSGINIDKTAPSITASRSHEPNADGWNNTPVTVSFACSDALSGVDTCESPVTLGSEGMDQNAGGDAVDVAGNLGSVIEGLISIDMTAPVVALSTGSSYTVDQTVSVTCSASDALSGVATSTCAAVGGPAYTFGVGPHTVTASAKDFAGNLGTASASFTVSVTPDSLCKLIERFSSSRTQARTACALLDSIEKDLGKGGFSKITLKIKLCAFSLWVNTVGKSIFSKQEADIIKSLVGALAA